MKPCFFHAAGKRYPYFEGWYLKHQNAGKTVIFIPAVHADKNGKWSASLQIISGQQVWEFQYPASMCKIDRTKFRVKMGENFFSEKGIFIKIETEHVSIHGKIEYSSFSEIEGNVMGPFQYVPLMECNHGVISMSHQLNGNLVINNECIKFTNGVGYIESDWGCSFPEQYMWTQCNFGAAGKNGIMVSCARIPFLGMHFNGCIACIHYEGQEYRFGTYYGAKIKAYGEGKLILKQGKMLLCVERLDEHPLLLRAPKDGCMERQIQESPSCRVQYRLYLGKEQLFRLITGGASFEQVL